MTDLRELIERVERAKEASNELDIAVEIALETAGGSRIRANSAGTKVIYTEPNGREVTCWAWDWTLTPAGRQKALATLRALQAKEQRP